MGAQPGRSCEFTRASIIGQQDSDHKGFLISRSLFLGSRECSYTFLVLYNTGRNNKTTEFLSFSLTHLCHIMHMFSIVLVLGLHDDFHATAQCGS
jgi:hypothetical protein